MTTLKVAVVEDEDILRISVADDLRDAGFQVEDFPNPVAALESIRANAPDIVLTDIRMPYMSGIELLQKVKEFSPTTFVVVMTAFGSVENAVKAMKYGAYDYLTKPFKTAELLFLFERIYELCSVRNENLQLKEILHSKYDLSSFVGHSEESLHILRNVQTVADTLFV